MAIGLATLVAIPAAAPAQGVDIDPLTLVSEQPLRSWQLINLQPEADSTLPDWDAQVWDFAEINGVMYVGGRFQTVRQYSGATEYSQPFLAAFDVATGQWIPSFRPVLDDGVYSLAVAPGGNRLLVGGEFTNVNGAPFTSGFAALDPFTGEPDPAFKLSVTRESGPHLVKDIEVFGNDVYLGGRFSLVQNPGGDPVRRYSLTRLNGTTGALDTGWDVPVSGGRIMAMDLSPDGSELYLGGFFTTIGQALGTKWMGMVRTADGVVVPLADPVPPEINFYVFDLAVSETKVYAGTEKHHLFAWDRETLVKTHDYFSSGYGGDYQATLVSGDVLWVGGHHHGFEQNNLADRTRRVTQWLTPYHAETAEPINGWVARLGMRDGVFSLIEDSEGKLWIGGDLSAGGTVPLQGMAVFPKRSDRDENNLARYQVATQSSDGDSGLNWRDRTSESRCNNARNKLVGPATAAVDGKTSGGAWECSFATTEPELNPWWQVDLGQTGEVDLVRIWNMFSSGNPQDLSDVWVAVSLDEAAINSTDPVALAADPAVSLHKIDGRLRWYEEIPVGVNGRYVRLFMNNATPTRMRLPEVEVLDLPDVSPPPPVDTSSILVPEGAVWQYLDTGGEAPVGWNDVPFDAATWGQGPSLLGFGDGDISTATATGVITTYLRHEFTVDDPDAIVGLNLDLLADDGAIAYLNGTEIHRLRMPAGPVSAETKAADTVWGAAERAWTSVPVPAELLNAGTNVLAVEAHNNWRGGNDLASGATLTATDVAVAVPPVDQQLIALDDDWRYLDTGVAPTADWHRTGFDDVAWSVGPAQLGYGDGDEATVIAEGPVPARHITTWFRRTVDIDDPADIARLDLALIRDDGAIVYVNGVERVRTNMPDGPVTADTRASDYAWGPGEREPQLYSIPADDLVAGANTIAVEIHSASPGSRDLSFALEVIGVAP